MLRRFFIITSFPALFALCPHDAQYGCPAKPMFTKTQHTPPSCSTHSTTTKGYRKSIHQSSQFHRIKSPGKKNMPRLLLKSSQIQIILSLTISPSPISYPTFLTSRSPPPPLPLLTFNTVTTFTLALFYAGYTLQQNTVRDIRIAIAPRGVVVHTGLYVPSTDSKNVFPEIGEGEIVRTLEAGVLEPFVGVDGDEEKRDGEMGMGGEGEEKVGVDDESSFAARRKADRRRAAETRVRTPATVEFKDVTRKVERKSGVWEVWRRVIRRWKLKAGDVDMEELLARDPEGLSQGERRMVLGWQLGEGWSSEGRALEYRRRWE